jgi:hypothetical protein
VVAELETATPLFVALLGGEVTGQGAELDHRWTELTWGGPTGVRLASPVGTSATPLREWLGGRAGRVHHLEFDVEDPGGVAGARPAGRSPLGTGAGDRPGRYWVVPPELNAGMRLVLRAE